MVEIIAWMSHALSIDSNASAMACSSDGSERTTSMNKLTLPMGNETVILSFLSSLSYWTVSCQPARDICIKMIFRSIRTDGPLRRLPANVNLPLSSSVHEEVWVAYFGSGKVEVLGDLLGDESKSNRYYYKSGDRRTYLIYEIRNIKPSTQTSGKGTVHALHICISPFLSKWTPGSKLL